MNPILRVIFVVSFLPAAGLSAQSDQTSAEARARHLLFATKSGQEGAVSCDQVDGAGKVLIEIGKDIRSSSTERAVIAFRLAARAGLCAHSEPLRGAAVKELADALFGFESIDVALAAAKESVEILQTLDDGPALASALNNLGNVHWWLNEMDAALDAFHRSFDLSTAGGD